MKQTASAGESKILEFQANQSGSFLYYCESCGGEESLATGNIVVVAKE
jgi:heme/copper-type cytochrome/quinol oxidase subunit 2